jgi:hypothetical protein
MPTLFVTMLVGLLAQHPEEVAKYNAYATLHKAQIFGSSTLKCEPYAGNVYRCLANVPGAYIRFYCSSSELGFYCVEPLVIPKG